MFITFTKIPDIPFYKPGSNKTIHIPGHGKLLHLMNIIYGIHHQIISLFTNPFFHSSKDSAYKLIRKSIPIFHKSPFDYQPDNSGTAAGQIPRIDIGGIIIFFQDLLNPLHIRRRYFFCFSMYDIGNGSSTDSKFLCHFFNCYHFKFKLLFYSNFTSIVFLRLPS